MDTTNSNATPSMRPLASAFAKRIGEEFNAGTVAVMKAA